MRRFWRVDEDGVAQAAPSWQCMHIVSAAHELLEESSVPTFSLETHMTLTPDRLGDLVVRMQGAFLDAPTLTLGLPDAERRFGVDRVTCEAVLGALVDSQVLARTRGGAYVRFFPRLAHAA